MSYTDILGRELHDGDVCVGKGTGRDVKGMDIGIWSGKSIAFKGGNKRSMGDVFLVVNPSEKELVIKKEIEQALQEFEKRREVKDLQKTIPLSKLEIGGIYKDLNGSNYIYLGKRKVTLTKLLYSHSEPKVNEGHCFVWCGSKDNIEEIKKQILNINSYRGTHSISVLKGNKKLTSFVRKVDLEFPMENEEEYHSCSRYSFSHHYKLIVEQKKRGFPSQKGKYELDKNRRWL